MRRDCTSVASLLLKNVGDRGMEKVPASVRMLVIDIDGTLLNPEGKITPRTLGAVRAAQQAGIVVTLATARRYCNTAKIATELGLDIPLIMYDGAMIIKHPDASVIYTHTMKADVAQQAFEFPFVAEGGEESAVLDLLDDFHGDATSNVNAAESENFESEVACFGAVDGGPEIERVGADVALFGEAEPGDFGSRIHTRILERVMLNIGSEEFVNGAETAAGKD